MFAKRKVQGQFFRICSERMTWRMPVLVDFYFALDNYHRKLEFCWIPWILPNNPFKQYLKDPARLVAVLFRSVSRLHRLWVFIDISSIELSYRNTSWSFFDWSCRKFSRISVLYTLQGCYHETVKNVRNCVSALVGLGLPVNNLNYTYHVGFTTISLVWAFCWILLLI